ncbi:MAG TPA: kelch repeat-containing protein [Candidatus Dormibacteraeota bacterium]|nr:kelch repeat-containing protein [Candidatus Dormibacteraeota bacterium]
MMRRLFLLVPLGLALSACQPLLTTTGAWSRQPSPPVSTSSSHVVATANGRVVVLGGFNPQTGEPLEQTVVFEPASSRWTDAAPIPEPRGADVAVPLADGTVLVTAGQGGNGVLHQLYRSTWIFDPSRNRWNRVGDLRTARLNPSAVRLSDGRVLLVGGSVVREDLAPAGAGQDPYQAVASAELYDPSVKTWSTAGDLSLARNGLALVALTHGGALAVGGCSFRQTQPGFSALADADVFSPVTSRWASTRPLPEPRCAPSTVGMPDGRALVIGGIVDQPNGFGTSPGALLFDSRLGSWASAGSPIGSGGLPLGGPGGIAPPTAAAVLLRDGRVFLPAIQAGPMRGRVTTTIVGGQLFDPSTGAWAFATSTAADFASRFGDPTPVPVALPSGRVVVLLDTVALGFDPEGRPPAGQALASLSLTWLILGLDGGLLMLLVISLLRGRRAWKRRSTPMPLDNR